MKNIQIYDNNGKENEKDNNYKLSIHQHNSKKNTQLNFKGKIKS